MISIDASALKVLKDLKQTYLLVAVRETMRALVRAGAKIQARLMRELPVGATGMLRRGVKGDTTTALGTDATVVSLTMANEMQYASFAEYGRGPGPVSPRVLEQWATQRGLNPFAVAASIAKHGTRRYRTQGPLMGEWEQMANVWSPPLLESELETAQEKITAELEALARSAA